MKLEINELKKLINQQNFPLDVTRGKMGICLCLYLLGRKFNNKTYESYAADILHNVLSNTQNITSIDLEQGLIGIGITLHYLADKHYIEGDINYMLMDADNLLLKNLNSKNDIDFEIHTLIDMLYYIAIRLGNKLIKKDYKYLFQETAIKLINKLSDRINSDFFEESIPYSIKNQLVNLLYLSSLLYKLDFYNNRLNKIMYEISYRLFSFLPILNSNKLLLIAAMSSLKNYLTVENWQKHIDLLKTEFDIDVLIHQEIREKNISISNGLSGIFLALRLSEEEFSTEEYCHIKYKLVKQFNIEDLETKLLNPKTNNMSFLYGELGALTIYNMLGI